MHFDNEVPLVRYLAVLIAKVLIFSTKSYIFQTFEIFVGTPYSLHKKGGNPGFLMTVQSNKLSPSS
jgi:hypothetical protein